MEYNLEQEQAYAYWMENVYGLGRKSRWELTEAAGSPKAVYEMTVEEWQAFLPEKKAEALKKAKEEWEAGTVEERYRQLGKAGIRYLSNLHPDYPQRLRKIPDPPFGIFLRGQLPPEQEPAVAVIGARECSQYGRSMAGKVAEALAEKGISVISGMARGIDGISQWTALRAGGNSYAVLGSGVDVCYPEENRNLYEALKAKGGILSEYLPGTQPKPGFFPMRNRIISGLSDVVLIVEAREKSGTLITADMALEQSREVYVVPGRLTDPLSRGCNRLIKQGAGIMISIEEMLEETGMVPDSGRKQKPGRQSVEGGGQTAGQAEKAGIFHYLDYYPKSTEQLREESGMGYREIICELTELCMENKVKQISPGQYAKKERGEN